MPDRRPLHVVLNAGSGTGDTKNRQEVEERFAAAGVEARIALATSGADVLRLAREAVAEGAQTLVAGGGDGTIGAVASVLVGTDRSLGVLPMGTYNHFARHLGIPLDLGGAVRTVLEGEPRRVDVGEVNGTLFLNNSSLGLYPAALEERASAFARFGRSRLTALASAAYSISNPGRSLSIRIVADGKEISRRTPILFVVSNAYQVQEYRLPGSTCLAGGKLAVGMTRPLGTAGLLWLALRTLLGRLHAAKDLEVLCAHEMWIDTPRPRLRVAMDGELHLMEVPLHYRLRCAALSVIAPVPEPTVEEARVVEAAGVR